MSRNLCLGALFGLLTGGGACAPALNSAVPAAASQQKLVVGATAATPVPGAGGQSNGSPSPADPVWEANLCACEPQRLSVMFTVQVSAPTVEEAQKKLSERYPKGCVPTTTQ
jgi:hypothetical protein